MKRTVVLAAVTALVALSSGGAAAQGSGHRETRVPHIIRTGDRMVLLGGETKTDFVPCPAGYVPTGGGGHSPTGTLDLNASWSISDSWWVTVTNPTPTTQEYVPNVICAQVGYQRAWGENRNLRPGEAWLSEAVCPAGMQVSGGGMASGPGIVMNSSGSARTSWRAGGINHDSEERTFTVQALCSTVPHSHILGDPRTLAPGETSSTTARCPAGQVPTGGGGFTTGGNTHLNTSRPFNTSYWLVTATNHTGIPQTLTPTVTCVTP
ncbi:hypothetical protein ACFVVX_19160 [Kitasatospora sp. NPDC058170]|uniref:hypothetical protein n=1 Tax=Kitasatospora sp. NPDC058170 TaxID=3346364 RepID=UPI0036DC0586